MEITKNEKWLKIVEKDGRGEDVVYLFKIDEIQSIISCKFKTIIYTKDADDAFELDGDARPHMDFLGAL